MDVNKLLTNIADFNLPKGTVDTELGSIDVNNSICFDLSSNRIGIGTVDPSYTIDISGTSNDIDIHINNNDISYNVYESIDILFKLIKEIHDKSQIISELTPSPTNEHYDLYRSNKQS
tara:strand:+ start:64 stop:417 length:354 start_codon:yes stop_codon:yes gene_type:complete